MPQLDEFQIAQDIILTLIDKNEITIEEGDINTYIDKVIDSIDDGNGVVELNGKKFAFYNVDFALDYSEPEEHDKRNIATDDTDARVNYMSLEEALGTVGDLDEYNELKERETEIIDNWDKAKTEEEIELITREQYEVHSKIHKMEKDARSKAYDQIYNEIMNQLETNPWRYMNEWGMDAEDYISKYLDMNKLAHAVINDDGWEKWLCPDTEVYYTERYNVIVFRVIK